MRSKPQVNETSARDANAVIVAVLEMDWVALDAILLNADVRAMVTDLALAAVLARWGPKVNTDDAAAQIRAMLQRHTPGWGGKRQG